MGKIKKPSNLITELQNKETEIESIKKTIIATDMNSVFKKLTRDYGFETIAHNGDSKELKYEYYTNYDRTFSSPTRAIQYQSSFNDNKNLSNMPIKFTIRIKLPDDIKGMDRIEILNFYVNLLDIQADGKPFAEHINAMSTINSEGVNIRLVVDDFSKIIGKNKLGDLICRNRMNIIDSINHPSKLFISSADDYIAKLEDDELYM